MDNKNLIEQMVQETFENTNEEGNIVSIMSKKSTKLSAIYEEERKCLILKKDDKELEVPQSWGPFRDSCHTSIKISSQDDNQFFFQVISAFFTISTENIDIEIKNPNFLFQPNKAA